MTPFPIIAHVSRVSTILADRFLGDRTRSPLFMTYGIVEALKVFKISSRVMFGNAAWLEVMEDHSIAWAGAFGQKMHFWVETEFHETVDLYVGAAHRGHSLYSSPNLWSKEIPSFYQYTAEGIAEAENTDDPNLILFLLEVQSQCAGLSSLDESANFPNEPMICNERKLIDDAKGSFRLFERAIQVRGAPPPPVASGHT